MWKRCMAIIAIVLLAAPGTARAVAATQAGGVYDWGNEPAKGSGSGVDLDTPTLVANTSGVAIRSIDAEDGFAYAVEANGTVLAWGDNNDGQLGIGNKVGHPMAAVQVEGLESVVQVNGGDDFGLALERNGTVWSWGSNASGDLGYGTHGGNTTVPRQVPGLSDVIGISAGQNHCLALLGNGTVMAWGDNSYGQLGGGDDETSFSPVLVPDLEDVTEVSAGNLFSEALLANGTVMAWGDDTWGQVGNGTQTTQVELPTPVEGLSGVVQISAGGSQTSNGHSLALLSNGTVVAWGNDAEGQLGVGYDVASIDKPVAVPGVENATGVSAGGMHSMVLERSGNVLTFGDNTDGQLGNGTFVSESTPETVFTGASQIYAGSLHSVALVSISF